MEKRRKWVKFFWRISSCHIVSYFIMGILALIFLKYENRFSSGSLGLFMRPTDSNWVALGPILQVIRGFIFSIVLWPIRSLVLEKRKGWLVLWGLFLGLAILGTCGPTPGSIEGFIYTKLSIREHLLGLPEVGLQTLLFSLAIYYWYKRPNKLWDIIMGIILILIMLMSISGFIFG